MAGAGYKLFQTGDVLTAAQVNTYLNEQTVMVFANAAARTSALTSVLAEGMVSYLQDTNAVEVYNGTAWVGVGNVGDITEVQAGVGISVASGTGPIPVITNSSTDLITTAGDILYGTAADTVARLGIGTANQVLKVNSGATAPEWAVDPTTDVVTTAGDLIYGTAADTVARLGIGTAGQVLQVNSGATAPEWATAAAGGGLTLLETLALSGSSTTSATISGSYVNLLLVVKNVYGSAQSQLDVRFNGDTGNNYYARRFRNVNGTVTATTAAATSRFTDFLTFDTSSTAYNTANAVFRVFRYTDTDIIYIETTGTSLETDYRSMTGQFLYDNAAAITSVTFLTSAGTFSGGTVYIYGEK